MVEAKLGTLQKDSGFVLCIGLVIIESIMEVSLVDVDLFLHRSVQDAPPSIVVDNIRCEVETNAKHRDDISDGHIIVCNVVVADLKSLVVMAYSQ